MKKLLWIALLGILALTACKKDDGGDDNGGGGGNNNGGGNSGGGVFINGSTWATSNVAEPGKFAAKPEDYGMFYQWGRRIGWSATEPRTSSPAGEYWDTDPYEGNEWTGANDPCPEGWRVPTSTELEKLSEEANVEIVWTKQNGVDGRLFTDKANRNSIFLPAAGCRSYTSGVVTGQGTDGYWWSSTPYNGSIGHGLGFNSNNVFPGTTTYSAYGFSVRCVRG